jgi:hypothetical protein
MSYAQEVASAFRICLVVLLKELIIEGTANKFQALSYCQRFLQTCDAELHFNSASVLPCFWPGSSDD